MLEEICVKTSEMNLSVLVPQTEIKNGAICNPEQYYNTIHRLTSSVLGVAANHNIEGRNNHESSSLEEVFNGLSSSFGASSIFVINYNQLTDVEIISVNDFYNWFKSKGFNGISLSDPYELMLSLEFPVSEQSIVKGYDKRIRNTIGSYYTPRALADKCTELTLDTYISQNTGIEHFSQIEKTQHQKEEVSSFLLNSSFADYSCGTGSFSSCYPSILQKLIWTVLMRIF